MCLGGIARKANPQTEALSQWALRSAARQAKRIAAVALARKLAGILFAMLQHGRDFDPQRLGSAPSATTVAA